MTFLYLGLDVLWLVVAILFLLWKRNNISIKWKFFIPAAVLIAAFFSLWSIGYATLQIWQYDVYMLSGSFISAIPFEESLAFLAFSFLFVVVYEFSVSLVEGNLLAKFHRWLAFLIVIGLLLLIYNYWQKLYTTIPSILIVLFMLQHLLYNYRWMGRFLICFLCVAPFIIIHRNILMQKSVVMISESEVSGIMLLDMPLADLLFYFLMLFMFTWLYENFQRIAERRRRMKVREEKQSPAEG